MGRRKVSSTKGGFGKGGKAGEMEVRTILAVLSSLEPFRNMAGKILLMKFSMRI